MVSDIWEPFERTDLMRKTREKCRRTQQLQLLKIVLDNYRANGYATWREKNERGRKQVQGNL